MGVGLKYSGFHVYLCLRARCRFVFILIHHHGPSE